MQDAIEAGRMTRENSHISFKTPVPSVTIVHRNPSYVTDIQLMAAYVREQLNTYSVNFSTDVSRYGRYVADPVMKNVGTRFKKDQKVVSELIRALSNDQIVELEDKKQFTLSNGSVINVDDVTVQCSILAEPCSCV